MNTWVVPALIGIVAFLIRFLLLGAIENDHYVYLARAHQILHGAWPVRDFVDPGIPLAYLLSAAAAAIFGPTLLTEAVLSVAMFAIAVAVTFVLVQRASGSVTTGALAVALLILLPPRLYNSSKVLVPVVAILFAWIYADRPSPRRAAALGAWTGVAFLFRHDYAVYIAAAMLPFAIVRHWHEWRAMSLSLATYSVVAVVVAAPWLIYVQAQQGLPEYVASALRFSAAERDRTMTGWPLVFYAIAALPVAALVVGLRGTRHLTSAHVVFASVLTFASELVLLRDEPGARFPDVIASSAVAIAIAAGKLTAAGHRNPERAPPILLTSAVITAVGIGLIVVRPSFTVPDIGARWQQVTTRLHDASPDIMPDPGRVTLVRFIERCVGPDERVFVGGFGPELPVLARRAFAGGLPDWVRGYYEDPADVSRARAQLSRERVALAVMLDGGDAFAASWPQLAAELRSRGLVSYNLAVASGAVEVWLRPATLLDGPTRLPCGTPPRR